jgi:hypothetical protein
MTAFGSLCAVLIRIGQGGEPVEEVSEFDHWRMHAKTFGMPKVWDLSVVRVARAGSRCRGNEAELREVTFGMPKF